MVAMAFYAQHDNTAGACQEELRERRRLADALKEIEQCQAIVMTSLQTWLRHKDHPGKTAEQAMERLMNARRQENLVFRNVLGIEPGRLAISRGQR
jgi:hypothetical protein